MEKKASKKARKMYSILTKLQPFAVYTMKLIQATAIQEVQLFDGQAFLHYYYLWDHTTIQNQKYNFV